MPKRNRRQKNDPAVGISLRDGNTLWFSRYVNKVREWHNLETNDMFEAIQRKAEILRSPALLAVTDSLVSAIGRFLKYRQRQGEYTRITFTNVHNALMNFARHAGEGATLASVRAATVQAWYDSERERGMESTALQYLVSLRALFRWAIEKERVRTDNPAAKIATVTPKNRARVRFADRETRDALIAAAPNDDLRFILYCGFHAGLRLNEISEARVFWFDLKQGLLHVQATPMARGQQGRGKDIVTDIYGMQIHPFMTKGKKDRTIPLTTSFQKFLSKYLKGRKAHEFIGVPERTLGDWFYRWNFKKEFRRFMTKQGFPWITPHVLRHTFASLLVMKGVSLYKVANWLGDTSAVAERHYAHLAPLDADIQHLE